MFNLKIIGRGLHKEGSHNFNIFISWSWKLMELRLFSIFIIVSFEIRTLLRRFSVRNDKLFGSSLFFVDNEHCSAKHILKSSAFSLKSVTNLLPWHTEGMQGIFLSFINVFSIDQWVLWLVVLSDNFWNKFG